MDCLAPVEEVDGSLEVIEIGPSLSERFVFCDGWSDDGVDVVDPFGVRDGVVGAW